MLIWVVHAVAHSVILIALYIYFWLYWVFVAVWDFLQLQRAGLLSSCGAWLLIAVASLLGRGLWGMQPSVVAAHVLSSCGSRALEHRLSSGAEAQQLCHTGSVSPWHVGSSQTRDQTQVSYIGRQLLHQVKTRSFDVLITFTLYLHRKGFTEALGLSLYQYQDCRHRYSDILC